MKTIRLTRTSWIEVGYAYQSPDAWQVKDDDIILDMNLSRRRVMCGGYTEKLGLPKDCLECVATVSKTMILNGIQLRLTDDPDVCEDEYLEFPAFSGHWIDAFYDNLKAALEARDVLNDDLTFWVKLDPVE